MMNNTGWLSWFEELFPQLFVWWDVAFRFVLRLFWVIGIFLLLIILVYRLTYYVEKKILASLPDDRQDKEKTVKLLWDTFLFLSVLVLLLFWIHLIWFDTTILMAALAFGIWVAFQDIIANVFAWVMIMINNTYNLWDIVEIDHEQYDYFGRIEELTMKYIVLRTVDMRRVIVPNVILILFPVRTYESEESVRYPIRFVVHYKSDISQVKKCILEALKKVSIINHKSDSKVMLENMWDHGLEFLVYCYVDPKCGMTKKRITWLISHTIYTHLLEKEIVIAYPHRTITLDAQDTQLFGVSDMVIQWI